MNILVICISPIGLHYTPALIEVKLGMEERTDAPFRSRLPYRPRSISPFKNRRLIECNTCSFCPAGNAAGKCDSVLQQQVPLEDEKNYLHVTIADYD